MTSGVDRDKLIRRPGQNPERNSNSARRCSSVFVNNEWQRKKQETELEGYDLSGCSFVYIHYGGMKIIGQRKKTGLQNTQELIIMLIM